MRNPIEIPAEVQTQLDQLLTEGLMLTAWKVAEAHGPLEDWMPGNALRLAAWIASGVGDDRLSSALDWKNWRHDRCDPDRAFWAIFARLRYKPPVILLPEIDSWLASSAPGSPQRADFLAMKAWMLATLRDFAPAGKTIEQALASAPERGWVHVQHSQVLVMEDRYSEALEAAINAVRLNPAHRPAVMQAVDCLIHLNRDEEAMDLLRASHRRTEHGTFMMRLQGLLSEREEHDEALHCLEEIERLMPLMTDSKRQWLAGRRADFLYMKGDIPGSLEASDRAPASAFHQKVAENLRRPDALPRKRKRLAVPFVRQHNMTCAPATLSALAKYWNRDHDHLEIAEAICDEGTPWHKERGWAESHGFIAREFRFSREILIALIDRDIPFTLTTSWVTGAHLQACIGYDDRQGIVLLRDPTHRHFGESLIENLVSSHPIHGPRCMLLLPHEEASRLDGLILPDEGIHDAYHEMALAIENHNRLAAEAAAATLRLLDKDHPLTLSAEAQLAGYLGHHEKRFNLIKRLSDRFPDHQPAQYLVVGAMQQLAEQTPLRQLLERQVLVHGVDPVFVSLLGELLLEDARQLTLAGHFLRRSLRLQRGEGRMLESLARHEIKCGNFQEAARLRRFASTLSAGWEPYAVACFESFRLIGKTAEGLDFLRERTRTDGARKPAPWLTLASALDSLNQHNEARASLEEIVRLLPDDGELRLKACRMMIFWGKDDRQRGLEWMGQAKGKVSENVWLRERAWTAAVLGDRTMAIHFWKALLVREPLAIDAYRALARLITEESGNAQAVRFLTQATERNPRHPALWIALADLLSGERPEASLHALNRARELDPDDVWVLRQRAEKRFDAGDKSGGLEDAREAVERAPMAPESHGVLASLLHKSGETAQALSSLREALRLNIDYTFALERLISWSPDPAAAREALAFISGEMDRQVSNGDCLAIYQRMAWSIVPPLELLESLRKFCDQRPDLWQTWSARIDQCLAMDQPEEARECAVKLTTAFPLLARTWIEVSKVEQAIGDHTTQAEALQKAVDLAPAWDWAVRKLGEILERLGRFDEARTALERAINYEPLNGANHGCLADLLDKMGQKDEAFSGLLAAMDLCPFYKWGWTTLAGWAEPLGRQEDFEEKIRHQSGRLAHNPEWWSIHAEIWQSLRRHNDALEAARSGLAVAPDHPELRDQFVTILCTLERFDEALAACDPPAPATREIQGRRAWVLMESGDGPAAIAAMKAVLEREPGYTWGWHQLSVWHHNRNEWSKLAEAARQWARLAPDQSVAHGYAGLAARELGDNETARHAFQRAFRMDPEYQFAGRELLKLQTTARDFEAAQTTLATLRHFAPGPLLDCEAVALALARGNDSEAFAIAAEIQISATHAIPLDQLRKEFGSRGYTTRWRELVESLIREGKAVSPTSLAGWAGFFSNKPDLVRAVKQLQKMNVPEESRNAAWNVLLRAAGSSGDPSLLPKWLRRHRSRFRENAMLWNTAGEMLLLAGKNKDTVEWLSGWQHRDADVGPHTLVNLSAATDQLHGPQASEEIRAAGIARFRTDDNTLYLRAGQGSYFASSGRLDEARQTLAPIEDSRISRYYIGLASLGRSVVAATDGDEAEAEHHYRKAIDQLLAWPADPAVIKHLVPTQKSLAKHIPWAAGKRRRIVKRWGGFPGDSTWQRVGKLLVIGSACVLALGVLALLVAGGMPPAGFIIPAVIAIKFATKNRQ